MKADPVTDLAKLLEEERQAILAGRWDALAALAPRKEAGLAALGPAGPGALQPLAGRLARNQALLLAALAGTREALGRRAALRASRAGLVTYDAQGTRAELPIAPPRVERRA